MKTTTDFYKDGLLHAIDMMEDSLKKGLTHEQAFFVLKQTVIECGIERVKA